MEFTLSLTSISGLFLSLAVLAAVPSLSVLMVTSRAVSHGFRHGLLVAAGVVLADMLFIIVALYGLTFFIPWMGQWQWLVRLLAASYLIWWAIQLWNRSTLSHTSPDQSLPASHKNSLLLGFTLTLADTKAILFYIGFLPTWLDSSRLTPFDISIILLITLVAVGGVKALYAFFAATEGQIHFTRTVPEWNKWAAVMLLIISVVILLNPVK